MKTALTARILPATRLLPVAALWAFLGRVRLVDSLDGDSSELSFVLDHPSKLAIGPLVEALVHSLSVAHPITDSANVADPDRRDTSLKEHLHDLPTQFMKEVRDLVVDAIELLTLGLNQLLPAVRATLFAIYLRVELGFEAVLVVSESTKLTTVDCERIIAREDSSEVLLSEIDSSYFVSSGSVNGFSVVLSTDNEPIRSLPDLDGARLFVYGPVNQNRILSALRGQAKHAILSERHALIGPPEHVVGFVATLRRIALPVVVVPGTNCFVELPRDFLGRLGRQHVVALTVPPAHCCFTDPVVLSVYRAPIPLADGVPQIRRRTRQPPELLGALNMEFAGQVHALRLVFNILPGDLLTRFASRADEVRTSRKGRKSMQMFELISKNVSTGSLESVNDLVGSVPSVCLDEEVNMVGPDRQ
ncbi:hypothetical protein GGP90_000876 [Salinibacter ruber]|nr:hypothetical protein [Salinibacter ruber]MCS3756113.1 hypothetical protein [Salinibacter ruber]